MLDIRNHSSTEIVSPNEIDGTFFSSISPCRMYSIFCQRRQNSAQIPFLFFTSLNVNTVKSVHIMSSWERKDFVMVSPNMF